MLNAVLVACGLLLIGFVLRAGWRPLARLYVPGSVVGGLIGLAVVQGCFQQNWAVDFLRPVVQSFRADWTGTLIAVVFAGMLLERPGGSTQRNLRETAQQGIAAWIIILGQLALGLAVVALTLKPLFGISIHLGQILEVSWAGGFGSSSAWGNVHQNLGYFPQALDVALFGATSGMLFGVLSGLVLVNLAVRRGWTCAPAAVSGSADQDTGPAPRPAALIRTPREIMDPLAFQGLLLAASFALGLAMQYAITSQIAKAAPGTALRQLENLPLFLFALLGGWGVRRFMQLIGKADLIDALSLHRLGGCAMDLLIVAALTSLRLEAVVAMLWPMLILLGVGAAWCVFTLLWLSPRLLPARYWFELGLINYGFATATTAQGLMLLRMIDPELKSDAAKIYALAAPLTAPFIGGGLITYALPLLLDRGWAPGVIGVSLAAMLVLYLLGRRLARQGEVVCPEPSVVRGD